MEVIMSITAVFCTKNSMTLYQILIFLCSIYIFQEAYRKWVCSSLVPYFAHEGPSESLTLVGAYVATRLRPCRSFCQSVEQRCPYLLPGDRAPAYPTQYAGEPTFLCRGEFVCLKKINKKLSMLVV